MKKLLKKLHIGSNESEDSEGSITQSSKGNNNRLLSDGSPSERIISHSKSEHNPFSAISGWLNSVTNKHNDSSPSSRGEKMEPSDSVGSSSIDAALDAVRRDRNVEEEYQIQMALELSAREDPEAVQIEAVKQISLGSCTSENTPAEVIAYRYWNYNALSYDDKTVDGFYDLYGIVTEPNLSKMPSLVDLQATTMGENISWEAILVNKAADTNLLNLEQKALDMAFKLRSHSVNSISHAIVHKLATLVSEHMGGPVGDPDKMLIEWRNLSHSLKSNNGSMVLPLGSLTIGLARHRALLFKVLADSLDIPCRLVKGQQLTGSDDVAMNFVKINGGREYIVDLMSDPGTLIPSDAAGIHTYNENSSSSSDVTTADNKQSKFTEKNSIRKESVDRSKNYTDNSEKPWDFKYVPSRENLNRPNHHARSPSWTEGVSSPAVRRMKAKDVSQYMIDVTKGNPQLAQKLHDVLLESGVVAPPNLFTEIYPEQLNTPLVQENDKKVNERAFLPPLPKQNFRSRGNVDNKQLKNQLELKEVIDHHATSGSEIDHAKYSRNVPVAVAAAAAAAVVASSMVVAAAKGSNDPKIQFPVAAAAAVVATTAVVNKQCEYLEAAGFSPDSPVGVLNQLEFVRSDGEADGDREHAAGNSEGERVSDRSTGNESSKSDVVLDNVADCEIPWEDIALGERIGLGSYGEVYRGDWHGTEVAVKKFLDQEIAGESLEEFKSEVLIMKRVRHPNVVLFMGAITRPPNLSIVTECLPRGSLYRLIHRPNNQLDERRRLRMALDAARGMNYLHNCTPMIVHRDLKSPNLLVDKNWIVKVCDFGLSRMKHSTFLSSRSTAGTAEWMAPEVLRNEPYNEKCDVYSFGVILWELCTLQQPWEGMNPMQVVGAVGFQHRRLDIPDDMDPVVGDLIMKCWQTDPKLRPSFAEIMATLKPLQKPITSSPKTKTRET